MVSNWRKDICCLDELQDAINSLLDKTVPWMRAHMMTDHSVADMVELLERVTHSDRAPYPKVRNPANLYFTILLTKKNICISFSTLDCP